MNKKAFTLAELLIVVGVLAVIAGSSLPYMLKAFTGFNQIKEQSRIINTLNEVSSIISRRIMFDKEPATKDNLNKILESLAISIDPKGKGYTLSNNIFIYKFIEKDEKDAKNIIASSNIGENSFIYSKNRKNPNLVKITLTANITQNSVKTKRNMLNFIVFLTNEN